MSHKVEKGDTVFWYPDATVVPENAVPATVVLVEGRTVTLKLMQVNCTHLTTKDCVRHVSDPWYEENPQHKGFYGGWDYSPQMKRLMAVENLLAESKPKGK